MWTCLINRIYIVFLPSHSSHVWQPLDVGVFSVLKRRYRYWFRERCYGRTSEATDKTDFLWALGKAWNEVMKVPRYIKTGFRASGLNTPKSSRDLKDLETALIKVDPAFGKPTARLLFRKMRKALDVSSSELTALEHHNSQLTPALEKARPKKLRKVEADPNQEFVRLKNVKEVKAGLKGNAQGPSSVTPQNEAQDEEGEESDYDTDDPDYGFGDSFKLGWSVRGVARDLGV
ncbi:hypothetical protein DL771_005174 [Monosporascus sp. 5C6A]|nr:hypothetical protein DL771_005174 [Monosporascus sp. 5C6A]